MTHHPVRISPEQAAVYTIEIQGQIDENWLSYFDGLEIEVVRQGHSAVTTITGCLIDQAALQGVLQHLYGLGLVLLRVERQRGGG